MTDSCIGLSLVQNLSEYFWKLRNFVTLLSFISQVMARVVILVYNAMTEIVRNFEKNV